MYVSPPYVMWRTQASGLTLKRLGGMSHNSEVSLNTCDELKLSRFTKTREPLKRAHLGLKTQIKRRSVGQAAARWL